jgi:hypothetical protein
MRHLKINEPLSKIASPEEFISLIFK